MVEEQKRRGKGRKVYKEMRREKKGRAMKKLVTYLMLLLCCFYVASVCHFLCPKAGKKKVKKRDLYRKISFDISKFKIKNVLRIT